MARTVPVGNNAYLGFQTDTPRDLLPNGVVYRMKDWIPANGAAARKRGGYKDASADLNALSAFTRLGTAAWAPFPILSSTSSEPHLVAVAEGGKVFRIHAYDGTGGAYVGTTSQALFAHPPIWHRDRLIIIASPQVIGELPWKYYDNAGTWTLALVGGTPPRASAGASWGDYLILANSRNSPFAPNRIFFSGVGDPDAWPSSSTFDMPDEVVAVCPLRNAIIVLGYSKTWLLTGDTPPPGGNLARRDLFLSSGTMDPRTVAYWNEYVLWANGEGVWRSDGALETNLVEAGGISRYWRSLCADFSFARGDIATAGVYRGYYFITLMRAGTPMSTLVCDLQRKAWFELTNIDAVAYATRPSGQGSTTVDAHEELFFAPYARKRMEYISPLWTPASTNASDANGVVVQPSLELAFDRLNSMAPKRLRRAFVSYDLRDAGAAPVLRVSRVLTPESSTYATMSDLPPTTEQRRGTSPVARQSFGVGLKLEQVGASSDTSIYGVELDAHELEPSR